MQENNISQKVHNVVLMEPGSEAQLITGCTLHPRVESGLHIGVTEVFLDRGATLTNTMIHNWAEGFHVRPRTGVIAGEGATFRNNYILLHPVRSVQSDPRVILQGAQARAQLNNIVVGRGDSYIDLGAHIELRGRATQAEVLSRAAAQNQSELALRTLVIGTDNDSRAHVDCRGMLLSEHAQIHAVPALTAARAPHCQLPHKAAVGPIGEEAVEYLMTRGLRLDEATSTLVLGFLKLELPGLPAVVRQQIDRVLAATAGKSL